MDVQIKDNNQTRRTLIERIKNRDDQKAWDEFAAKYQKLILGVALKCGLREALLELNCSTISQPIHGGLVRVIFSSDGVGMSEEALPEVLNG